MHGTRKVLTLRNLPPADKRPQVPGELVEYWNRRLYEKRERDWT